MNRIVGCVNSKERENLFHVHVRSVRSFIRTHVRNGTRPVCGTESIRFGHFLVREIFLFFSVLLHWFNIVQMTLFWVYWANPKTKICNLDRKWGSRPNLSIIFSESKDLITLACGCVPFPTNAVIHYVYKTNQNRKWCLAWYLWIELTDFLFLVHEHAWLDIRLLLVPVKWGDLRSIRCSQPKTPSERWLILIIHSCASPCSADRR